MYSQSSSPVHRLAAEIYEESYAYLLRIAKRNAVSPADAEEAVQDAFVFFISDYDPQLGAPPLAWLTLTMKRRCWRLREAAHHDRRIGADPEGDHEEPTALIERQAKDSQPVAERVAECDEARRRRRGLKPDERTALGMVAAGCTYGEVAATRDWTYTKVNRSIYEGRSALREAVEA